MTYTPTIFDWPVVLEPMAQMFTGGSQPVVGGMTLGGAMVDNPEPGGRAVLTMEFSPFRRAANRQASWTATMLQAGVVFRIPLTATVQMVPPGDIFGAAADEYATTTDPWTGEAVDRWNPGVLVNASASAGAATLTADFDEIGQVLLPGHVVGYQVSGKDFAAKVVAVTYDVSNEATVTIFPPLRRAITTATKLRLRPVMLATCVNAEGVVGSFLMGRTMQFGAARFVEALV